MSEVSDFPLQLFRVVEEPYDEVCPTRNRGALSLLSFDQCCLERPFSDITLKSLELFRDDWTYCSETGRCTKRLWYFLILIRLQSTSNNQFIEGVNSMIQRMAKVAPHMKLGLANARMSAKVGEKIDAATCADEHWRVVEYKTREGHHTRFLPGEGVNALPCPRGRVCAHVATSVAARVLGFRSDAFKYRSMGAGYAHVIGSATPQGRMFIMGKSYYSTIYAACGVGVTVAGATTFVLSLPFRIRKVEDLIADCVVAYRAANEGEDLRQVQLTTFKLSWNLQSRRQAAVLPDAIYL